MSDFRIELGDCVETMRGLPADSVDAVVTDPPAGIAFMGREWDKDKGGRDAWIAWMEGVASEALRVIKPGGHALVWALPRTSHWTGMAWERAGWQPRDKVYHAFGSGFPKSMNVGKAFDRAAGAEREVVGEKVTGRALGGSNWRNGDAGGQETVPVTAPATDAAKQWEGWGTALKPAVEEWWLFRKPTEGAVIGNITKHGTGAINIDGCRIPHRADEPADLGSVERRRVDYDCLALGKGLHVAGYERQIFDAKGRWPAHLIRDGSEEVEACFPGEGSGSASRFFYVAKPSSAEREFGLDSLPKVPGHELVGREEGSAGMKSPRAGAGSASAGRSNVHPTVKPIELMRYFCRLITPPGGTVLDPFCGSGTTGIGAVLEGFNFIGCEAEEEFAEIARMRIGAWRDAARAQPALPGLSDTGDVPAPPAPAQRGLFDE